MKRYLHIFLAFLASASIWLISNLSKDSTGVVTVMVIAHSSIEGRRDVASAEVPVVASVTTSGFRLIALKSGANKAVHVVFSPFDLKYIDGDFYQILPAALYAHSGDIFGASVGLQSVVSSNVIVRFPPESFVKVPVKVSDSLVKYKPQYTRVGPISVYPDSVLVYGEPSRIAEISFVSTNPVLGNNVKSSIHGKQKLEHISGVRFSTDEVNYSIIVSRYVELRYSSEVVVRNVPESKMVITSPSSVDVSYKVVFPLSGEYDFSGPLYVDYEDFLNSISGKCFVKTDSLPQYVISYSVEPEFCQCIER